MADIGTSLRDVTFVVLDLETTGGSPAEAGITEVGAVKVRHGEVLGEFATLVNPGVPIPPFIAALTGITDPLVANAPRLSTVLPSLLEFLSDAVLVAHNARYDVGFLKGACALHDTPWPALRVVDTARIARTALQRDEVPNCKLGTLAAHFRSPVSPTHRALDDARATVAVLHGLLERLGDLGVSTLEDLQAFTGRVSPVQRTKRQLADGLPQAPGVYVFRDALGQALYVGTSTNIARRVRTYFTASETRRRMTEMIQIATRVDPIVCATVLEARVRELRLIAAEQPRYNRRSTRPTAQAWLRLTAEAYPRVAVTRTPAFGPAATARALAPVAQALVAAGPLRSCTTRLSPDAAGEARCGGLGIGTCPGPCRGPVAVTDYAAGVERVRQAMAGDVTSVIDACTAAMNSAAHRDDFEEAAAWRDRLQAFLATSMRHHRLAMLARTEQIVAARPSGDGGWHVHVVRHGVLAAAGTVPPRTPPSPVIEALIATAAVVPAPSNEFVAGLTEEAEEILAWLNGDGVRLVSTTAPLTLPVGCGGAMWLALREVSRMRRNQPMESTDDHAPRPLGPVHRAVSRIAVAPTQTGGPGESHPTRSGGSMRA